VLTRTIELPTDARDLEASKNAAPVWSQIKGKRQDAAHKTACWPPRQAAIEKAGNPHAPVDIDAEHAKSWRCCSC